MAEGTHSRQPSIESAMTLDQFAREIASARKRIAPLLASTSAAPERAPGSASEAEMTLLLEELNVAEEEMRQQADELILTRDQVEQERLRYMELFENAPDAYLITDEVGVVREANRARNTCCRSTARTCVGNRSPPSSTRISGAPSA